MFRILAAAIVTTVAALAVNGLSADAAPNKDAGSGSGAYQEQLDGESLYYVNTVSVGNGAGWVELCSDDVAEARGWAAATDARSSVQRTPAGERQNEKFFEFRYEDASLAILMRVHKCSYTQPTADFLAGMQGEFGKYNGSTKGDATREFAEYLWFIRNYQFSGTTLDRVERAQVAGNYAWNVHYTRMNFGGFGDCDEERHHKQTVSVSRSTGVVTISDVVEGTVEVCA